MVVSQKILSVSLSLTSAPVVIQSPALRKNDET
jgi:hypothetical protein